MTAPHELPTIFCDLRETLFPKSCRRHDIAFRRVFTNDFLRNLQEALWKTPNKQSVLQTFGILLARIGESYQYLKEQCRQRYLSSLGQRYLSSLNLSTLEADFTADYCFRILHYAFECLANCEQPIDEKTILRIFPDAKDSRFLRSYLTEAARVIRHQDHRITENRIRLPICLVEKENADNRYRVGWLRISKIPSPTRGLFPDPFHLFSTQFGKIFQGSVDRFVATDPELFENNTFVFRFKDLPYPQLLSGPSISGALWLGSRLLQSFPSHIPDGIIILAKVEDDGRLSAVGETREKMLAILADLKRDYMGVVKIIVPLEELTTAKEVKATIEKSDSRESFSIEILAVAHLDELKRAVEEQRLSDYRLIKAPSLIEQRQQLEFLDSFSRQSPLATDNFNARHEPLRLCTMPGFAVNHVQTETIRNSRIDCRERLRNNKPGRIIFHGPGSIGKTQLILSLGHNLRDSFQQILFVDLKGYSHMEMGSRTCSEHLLADLSGYHLSELKSWSDQDIAIAFTRAVQQRIQTKQRILFLIDNVREYRQIAPILIGDNNPNIWYMITARENLPLQGFESRPIPQDWCLKDAETLAKQLLPVSATPEDLRDFLDQTGRNPLTITMAGSQWSTSGNREQRIELVQRSRRSASEKFLETLNGLQPHLRNVLLAVSWLPNDFTAEHVQSIWHRILRITREEISQEDTLTSLEPKLTIAELVNRGWFTRMTEETAEVQRYSLHDVNREELQKYAQNHFSLEQREGFILDYANLYSQAGRFAERGLTQTSVRNELLSLEATNLQAVLDGLRQITTSLEDSIHIRGEFATVWGKILVREHRSKRQQRLVLIDELLHWIETYSQQLELETNGQDNDVFFIERYELWMERGRIAGKKQHKEALHSFQTAYQLVQGRDPVRTLEVLQIMVHFCKDKYPQHAFQYASEYLERAKKDDVKTQANAYTLLAKINSLEHPIVALKNFLKALTYLRSTKDNTECTRKLMSETTFQIAENAAKLDYIALALDSYQQSLAFSITTDQSENHAHFMQCLTCYFKTAWLNAEHGPSDTQIELYDSYKHIIKQYLRSLVPAAPRSAAETSASPESVDDSGSRKAAIACLPLLGLLFLAESRRDPQSPGYDLPEIVEVLQQCLSLNVVQPSDFIAFAEERMAETITWNTFRQLAFHLRKLANAHFPDSPIRATLYLTIAKREILEHNLARGHRLLWKAVRCAERHQENYLCGVILEEIIDLTMNVDALLEISGQVKRIREIHANLQRNDHTTAWNTLSFRISLLELKCKLLQNDLEPTLHALSSLQCNAQRDGILNTTVHVPHLLQAAILASPTERRMEHVSVILNWLHNTPDELQLNTPSFRIELLIEVLKRINQDLEQKFVYWLLQAINETFRDNPSLANYISAVHAAMFVRNSLLARNFATGLSQVRLSEESYDAESLREYQISIGNYIRNIVAFSTGKLSEFQFPSETDSNQKQLILALLSFVGDNESASNLARGFAEMANDPNADYVEFRNTQANVDLDMGLYRETFETLWKLDPLIRDTEHQVIRLCLEAALHRGNGNFPQALLLAHRSLSQATLNGLAKDRFVFVFEELARNYARLGDARNCNRSLRKALDLRTQSFLIRDRVDYYETCIDCFLSLGDFIRAEHSLEALQECTSTIESEFCRHRYQIYRYRFLLATGKKLDPHQSTELLNSIQALQEHKAWHVLSDLVELIELAPQLAPLVYGIAHSAHEYIKAKRVDYLEVLRNSTLEMDASLFSNGDTTTHQAFGRTDRFRAIRPKELGNRPNIGSIFEEMEKHFDASGSKGIRAVYQFNITGEEGGMWAFSVDNGTCHSIRGGVRAPTVEVELSADTWFAIREGSLNSQAAFGKGLLRIRGDMNIAVQLMSCFPIA